MKLKDGLETKVVIFCGGQGTRFGDAGDSQPKIPKPLVDVGGMPLLWHIMKIYSAQGFNNFVLCLGHKGEMIKDFFLNYKSYKEHMDDLTLAISSSNPARQLAVNKVAERKGTDEDWKVSLVNTGLNSLTGQRLYRVREYIDTDDFMLTYGDGVGDIDLLRLSTDFRKSGALGAITIANPTSRFGEIKFDKDHRITSFVEKPVIKGEYVNAGFMMFRKSFLDQPLLRENLPLETVIAEAYKKEKIHANIHDGFWYAVDNNKELLTLRELWDSEKAPWRIW